MKHNIDLVNELLGKDKPFGDATLSADQIGAYTGETTARKDAEEKFETQRPKLEQLLKELLREKRSQVLASTKAGDAELEQPYSRVGVRTEAQSFQKDSHSISLALAYLQREKDSRKQIHDKFQAQGDSPTVSLFEELDRLIAVSSAISDEKLKQQLLEAVKV